MDIVFLKLLDQCLLTGNVRETRQERRSRERSQKKGVVSSPPNESPQTSSKRSIAPLICSCLGGIILTLVGVKLFSVPEKQIGAQQKADPKENILQGKTYGSILEATPEQVSLMDIAEMNLLCGSGLSGTEKIDIEKCLDRLYGLANFVRNETTKNWYRWERNPEEYENSEAYYKMAMLISIVRQDYEAKYNPELISDPSKPLSNSKFYKNGCDIFLQGLLSDQKTGTCANMPVFYVSIARRLKYPVYLVASKGHLFCRWDDGKERMNFEGTGEGIRNDPDEKYMEWPFPISEQELKTTTYLKNLNPQQELAVFLSSRAQCLVAARRNAEGLTAVSQALNIVQKNGGLSGLLPQMATTQIIPENVFNMRQNTETGSNGKGSRPNNDPYSDIREVERLNARNQEMLRRQLQQVNPNRSLPLPNGSQNHE